MSANSGIERNRAVAAIVSVMSICRNSVTCGAVKALRATAAAVCLRTPRIGMRSSRATAVTGANPAGTVPVSAGPVSAGPAVTGPLAAACTSSRVIEPPGPVPDSRARSTPRSLASLRTGGLASTAVPWPAPGAAAPLSKPPAASAPAPDGAAGASVADWPDAAGGADAAEGADGADAANGPDGADAADGEPEAWAAPGA